MKQIFILITLMCISQLSLANSGVTGQVKKMRAFNKAETAQTAEHISANYSKLKKFHKRNDAVLDVTTVELQPAAIKSITRHSQQRRPSPKASI